MPNRILKESICTSETLDALSVEGERFFIRLLVVCDDFGRFDARPSVLRARCFPLKLDKVTDKLVSKWLYELIAANLVWTYGVEDKIYLQITKWKLHQQMRATKSKYPEPLQIPEQAHAVDRHAKPLQSTDSNGKQRKAVAPESRIRESDSMSESDSGIEEGAPGAAPASQPGMGEALAKPKAEPEILPQAVQVYVNNGGEFQKGALADGTTKRQRAIAYIQERVPETPEALALWGRIVFAYCAFWSSKSYTIMVNDYFLAGRVPGESGKGGNGSTAGSRGQSVVIDQLRREGLHGQ